MIHRNLSRNRSGGIEGLPLQLMIIIMVATMGTAVIVGWMGSIDSPHYIGDVQVTPTGVEITTTTTGGVTTHTIGDIKIQVFDQSGEPLPGAFVYVENGVVFYDDGDDEGTEPDKPMETTDKNGIAEFKGMKLVNYSSKALSIHFNVSYPGYNEKTVEVMAVMT